MIDIRWLKNRHKLLSRVYVSTTYFRLPEAPNTAADAGTFVVINLFAGRACACARVCAWSPKSDLPRLERVLRAIFFFF